MLQVLCTIHQQAGAGVDAQAGGTDRFHVSMFTCYLQEPPAGSGEPHPPWPSAWPAGSPLEPSCSSGPAGEPSRRPQTWTALEGSSGAAGDRGGGAGERTEIPLLLLHSGMATKRPEIEHNTIQDDTMQYISMEHNAYMIQYNIADPIC